jgi:hypothetical protein
MSYRARTVLLLIVIELLIAGFWLFTAGMPGPSPDAAAERGEIFGMIMGVVAGLSIPLYLLARGNDRKKAAAKDAE